MVEAIAWVGSAEMGVCVCVCVVAAVAAAAAAAAARNLSDQSRRRTPVNARRRRPVEATDTCQCARMQTSEMDGHLSMRAHARIFRGPLSDP